MTIHKNILTIFPLILTTLAAGSATAAPPAPALLAPASGATVVQPFMVSWSAVTDAAGVTGYNWQISPSSTFANILSQGSTNGQTQGTVSGLASGGYFIRVQAVDAAFTQGAWSAAHSITISGSGPGAPVSPVLLPTKAYSTFHPYELEVFNWNVVPGALTYTLQFSLDSTFSVPKTAQVNNLSNPTMSFQIANPEGTYFARVFSVNANGILSPPSNSISFSVFFDNPIGPPPATLSPMNGGVMTLPITLSWSDVPNPQPNGYEFEIAKDSSFKNVELDYPQSNDAFYTLLTLTPGTKFWHVRSVQGDSTPLLPAETAWSATGTFTVTSAPPTPVSITLANPNLYSGDSTFIQIQLTAAVPAAGTTMTLTSSNQAAFPVPASFPFPGTFAWASLPVQTGQVTTPAPITLTATINSQSTTIHFTVNPASPKSIDISPATVTGGSPTGGFVMLNGEAPPGGAVISVSSSSPAVTVPATVTASAGFYWALLPITTSPVTVNTPATLTATYRGNSVQSQMLILAPQPAASITLSPSTVVGGTGTSFAAVLLAAPDPADETLPVTVSNPAIATGVPASVFFPAGTTSSGFNISTALVTSPTTVTISIGGGKTVSAVLTVTPAAQVAVSAVTLAPPAVVGGSGSVGTVTLGSTAPASGAVVSLSSTNTSAATVPATVTVAGGATSATFAISTSAVSAATPVTISAAGGGVTRTAALSVNPAPQTATLTVVAGGRNGVTVVSSPAGVSVPTGGSGTASFTIGTKVTLSVTSGRDAIWSGACSSGGSKTKTCALTLTGNATVNVNVQ